MPWVVYKNFKYLKQNDNLWLVRFPSGFVGKIAAKDEQELKGKIDAIPTI